MLVIGSHLKVCLQPETTQTTHLTTSNQSNTSHELTDLIPGSINIFPIIGSPLRTKMIWGSIFLYIKGIKLY